MKDIKTERISLRQICQSCYSMENKVPSEDASESYIKKKYECFSHILDALQIDPNNLKDSKGNYSFSEEHKTILQDVLLKYTDKDFKQIRKGIIATEDARTFIENMRSIIQDCMYASKKDVKKIREQLSSFYTAVEADESVVLANFQVNVKDKLDSFYENTLGNLLLRRSDKILLLEELYKDFEVATTALLKAYSFIASQVDEFRSEELAIAGVATQRSRERHKFVEASYLWDKKIADDDEIATLQKELETNTADKLSKRSRHHTVLTEIQRRKDLLCEQAAAQYGITAANIKSFRTEEQAADSSLALATALDHIGLHSLPYLSKDRLDSLFPYPTRPEINMTQEGRAQIEEYIQQEQKRRGQSFLDTAPASEVQENSSDTGN